MSFLRAAAAARSLRVPATPSFTAVRQLATSVNGVRTTDNSMPSVLRNVEDHWESIPLHERIEVQKLLQKSQDGDWKAMSLEEKKAAFYIAYGDYGARRPKGSSYENWVVFQGFVAGVLATGIIWNFFRYIAPPPPRSMTLEWQEASNEHLKEMNADPISGISSEGYKGRGMIQ